MKLSFLLIFATVVIATPVENPFARQPSNHLLHPTDRHAQDLYDQSVVNRLEGLRQHSHGQHPVQPAHDPHHQPHENTGQIHYQHPPQVYDQYPHSSQVHHPAAQYHQPHNQYAPPHPPPAQQQQLERSQAERDAQRALQAARGQQWSPQARSPPPAQRQLLSQAERGRQAAHRREDHSHSAAVWLTAIEPNVNAIRHAALALQRLPHSKRWHGELRDRVAALAKAEEQHRLHTLGASELNDQVWTTEISYFARNAARKSAQNAWNTINSARNIHQLSDEDVARHTRF